MFGTPLERFLSDMDVLLLKIIKINWKIFDRDLCFFTVKI